jgi:hypothetical protein
VIRQTAFYLLSALLVVSALGVVLEAVFTSGVYGCTPPLSIVLIPPLGLSGLLCLALAVNRRQRIRVAALLGVGAIASLRVLSLPFGYRFPYEGVAIGDVRTVISAEAAYESTNGYYDTLECLNKPSACIPGYSTTSPTFLDATLAQAEPHLQYRRWLIPGPPVTGLPASASRTSFRRFAYVAVPLDSRQRSFCGDATGQLFEAPNRIDPKIRNGQCDEDPRFTPVK